MLSTRLVELIETHWEEITARLITAIKQEPDLLITAKRSDLDVREGCRTILANLGYLLSSKSDDESKRRFQKLGRIRYNEGVPLHEVILRLQLLKEKTISFVHEQGFPMTAMHLYAEGEFELRLARFFDVCVYNVVLGYEDAMRMAQRLAS